MVMKVPDKKLYESEYVHLADGELHDVEMIFCRDIEAEYNGKKKNMMLFSVLREWVDKKEVRYDPPKKFETGALVFAEHCEKAANMEYETLQAMVMYDLRTKKWDVKQHLTQRPKSA